MEECSRRRDRCLIYFAPERTDGRYRLHRAQADRRGGGLGIRPASLVGAGPLGGTPMRVDFEKLHARRYQGRVTNKSAQHPVDRRRHRLIIEMADHKAFEYPRPDLNRGMPATWRSE
jgi:hypothetical protein